MDTAADVRHYRELDADLIGNGWHRLTPEEVLETLNRGTLGVHGSDPRGL